VALFFNLPKQTRNTSDITCSSFQTWSDGIASSMYKGLGARVCVLIPAEPVCSDGVVTEMGVVGVGKAGHQERCHWSGPHRPAKLCHDLV